MTETTADALDARFHAIIHPGWRRRLVPLAVVLAVIAYLLFSVFYFQMPTVADKARTDLVGLFMLDAYAHKVHVTQEVDEPEAALEIRLEGSRFTEYDTPPGWVETGGGTRRVDLGDDGSVVMTPGRVTLRVAGYEPIVIATHEAGPRLRSGPQPAWLSVTPKKINARPSTWSRLQVTGREVEVHRYFLGWENFLFDWDSPLHGMGAGEVVATALSAERLDADMPNWQLVLHEFWDNQEWQHGEVFHALFITLVMAIVGTLMAALVALPLAFAAARNVNPLRVGRFALKRGFDCLRGIDHLIWSLIFIRAFGLGPLSGIFAFLFTETGTFGKLFSEAIENIDRRQPEGVQATGASPVQKYRFGVLPQIIPVFVSQLLYFFESNTRSATVVGALGAGGIGLKLLETIKTRNDWENTLYLIVLTILVVMIMDVLSARLRRRLIAGAPTPGEGLGA